MLKSQSQKIIYGHSSYESAGHQEGKPQNQSTSMNSSTLHDSNVPSKVNKTKGNNNSTLLHSVTDIPNTFILPTQQDEVDTEQKTGQKKRKREGGKQGSYLDKVALNNKKSQLKFPEIEHSPDRIRQYERKQYGELSVHLPTLCFNSGWQSHAPSKESSKNLTRVRSEHLKPVEVSSTLPNTGTKGAPLQPKNPFKKSRKGEALLYQHEIDKRGEDEQFVHTSKVSLVEKSVPRRIGQVRELDKIPEAKLPERLKNKQQMVKSQSMGNFHKDQPLPANLQSSIKQSLQVFMEQYEKHSLVQQKTRKASKQASVEILQRANTMGKEKTHAFLAATRDILRTNMSIENIKEESMKLKEYIIMEQEKVHEAKLQFAEDCVKFKEFVQQLNQKSKIVENQLEEGRKQKQKLQQETENIHSEIKAVKAELKRVEDQLEEALACKSFVEEVLECGDFQSNAAQSQNEKLFVTQNSKLPSGLSIDIRSFRKNVTSLEKANLSMIEDINEDERMKENQMRQMHARLSAKEADITAFEGNLQRLETALKQMQGKNAYFQKKTAEMKGSGERRDGEQWKRVEQIIDHLFFVLEPEKDQNKSIIKKLERIEYDLLYLNEARDYMLLHDGTKKQCYDKEKEIDLARRHEKVVRMKEADEEERQRYIAKNEERAKRNFAKAIQKGTKTPLKRSEKEELVRKKKKSVEWTEEEKDLLKYVYS